MKKLIFAGILVVVAALFTACGGAGSPSEETGTVYVSEGTADQKTHTLEWTFNPDGTFLIREHTSSVTTPWDAYMGTYTGDASQDGTITIAFTKSKGIHDTEWSDLTDDDALRTINSITINNGSFECSVSGFPFIRQ